MGCTARRLLTKGAIPLGCALAALWASPAIAQSSLKLLGADSFELSADVRVVAVDGETSWVDGGFGKLRSGSDGDLRLSPQLGNASLVWKPQFTWSLGAILVGSLQGGERTEAGLSQAYLTFRPMRSDKIAVSARAGLMARFRHFAERTGAHCRQDLRHVCRCGSASCLDLAAARVKAGEPDRAEPDGHRPVAPEQVRSKVD